MKTNYLKWLLLIGIFFFYLLPPLDTDLGWHLFYGKHIFETGSIIRANPTSFYLPNYLWVHCFSLHQLIAFTLFKFFGFWGITIFGSLIITLSFFFLFKSYSKKSFWLIISSLFLIFVSFPVTSLGYRGQFFSILGISFIYYLILKNRKFSLKQIILLAVVFCLWTNSHGGFPLGLALLALYTLEKLWLKKKDEALNLILTTGVSILATLINPFGWKVYPEIYRHIWYPLNKLIAEWTPPNKISVLAILLVSSLIVIGFIIKKKPIRFLRKEKIFFLTLSWLLFTLFAFKARRHLPFAGLASIHLVLNLFPSLKVKRIITQLIIILVSLVMIIWRLTHFPNLVHGWDSVCQQSKWTLPCQAVEYLKDNPNTCQNIFNTYEWGGYLTWYLPERKIFTDGRMPAWPTPEGKSPYTIYLEILQTREGFNDKLLQYGADCIFIAKGTFLDLELKEKNDYPWKSIYEDKISTIYQKQN